MCILLALLGKCSAECTNGGDALSDTTNTDNNYLDLRQKMDSLSAKMCASDILLTELKDKVPEPKHANYCKKIK